VSAVREDRIFHLNDRELDEWNRTPTDLGRRLIEANARKRIAVEQETAANIVIATTRLEAETAAARAAAAEPLPSIGECSETLARNPQAISFLRARIEDLHREVRNLPGCPVQRVDRYVEGCLMAIRLVQSPAHAVLRLEQAIRWLYDQSANRGFFDAQRHADAINALPIVAAPTFDVQNFLGRLVARGIVLAVNPAGKLVATLPSLLSAADRATINANRAAICHALSKTEEI
jgi:hypothetical protein